MVFCRTKRRAQAVADELTERGFAAGAVHGDLRARSATARSTSSSPPTWPPAASTSRASRTSSTTNARTMIFPAPRRAHSRVITFTLWPPDQQGHRDLRAPLHGRGDPRRHDRTAAPLVPHTRGPGRRGAQGPWRSAAEHPRSRRPRRLRLRWARAWAHAPPRADDPARPQGRRTQGRRRPSPAARRARTPVPARAAPATTRLRGSAATGPASAPAAARARAARAARAHRPTPAARAGLPRRSRSAAGSSGETVIPGRIRRPATHVGVDLERPPSTAAARPRQAWRRPGWLPEASRPCDRKTAHRHTSAPGYAFLAPVPVVRPPAGNPLSTQAGARMPIGQGHMGPFDRTGREVSPPRRLDDLRS